MYLAKPLASALLVNLFVTSVHAQGYTRLGRTCDNEDAIGRLAAVYDSEDDVRQACDPDSFCHGYTKLDGLYYGILDSIGDLHKILITCDDGFEIWQKNTQTPHVSRSGENCVDSNRYSDLKSCRSFDLGYEECDEAANEVCCECGGGERSPVVTPPPGSDLVQIFDQFYEADDTTSLVLKNFDPDSSGFSGNIPNEIYQLTMLTKLDLSENAFSGTIPSGIEALTDLEELFITGNYLTGKLPGGLAILENLKVVNIEFNGPFNFD